MGSCTWRCRSHWVSPWPSCDRVGGWATTTAGDPLADMAFGLIVWLVMQYLVWDAIDPAAAERFTPWVFAIGHLMYGWSPAWPSPAPAAAWARSEPPADHASSTGGQFCTR